MTFEPGARTGPNRLLASLSEADLASLAPHLRDSEFEQGVVLQDVGETIERVFFPRSGMISLLAIMEAGDGVEIAMIGQEGAIGIVAGLGGERAIGRALVQLRGVFTHIAAGPFRAALAASATMRERMTRFNDTQMSLISQVAGCNALHPASARLCRWLLQTLDRNESRSLPLTHEFLSQMLGVQRTTVSMLARDLQAQGLISYRRGRIEVVDRTALEKRACECYAATRRKIEEVFHETPT